MSSFAYLLDKSIWKVQVLRDIFMSRYEIQRTFPKENKMAKNARVIFTLRLSFSIKSSLLLRG